MKSWKIFWIAVITILVLAVVAAIVGCQAKAKKTGTPIDTSGLSEEGTITAITEKIKTEIKYKTIFETVYKTNWLATACIIAILVGLFAGLKGIKTGWIVMAVGGAGLFVIPSYQRFATHEWLPDVSAVVIGIVGAAWALLHIKREYIDKRAFKEVVVTTEKVKEGMIPTLRKQMFEDDGIADDIQKKSTRKKVKKLRDKIKKRKETKTKWQRFKGLFSS